MWNSSFQHLILILPIAGLYRCAILSHMHTHFITGILVTITILDIIQHPVLYLKHQVLKTGFQSPESSFGKPVF
jgi:hypothetical protein